MEQCRQGKSAKWIRNLGKRIGSEGWARGSQSRTRRLSVVFLMIRRPPRSTLFPYAPDRIRAQLDDPRHVWWAAQREQRLVGFAHAVLDGADCKLDKLYVHPGSQRQG